MAKESNNKEKGTTKVEKTKKSVEKEEVKAEVKSTKKSGKETAKKSNKEVAKKSSKEATKKAKTKNGFFKEFKAELKKVVWPTPKEVANSTTAVIVIVLITTLLVFILDFTFEKLIVNGTEKLTSIVSSNDEDNEANTEDVVADPETDIVTTTTPETTVE